MPTLDELRLAAFKTELVLSRRLMRNDGLPERDALIQTLERHGVPLQELLSQRALARDAEAIRKAERKRQKNAVQAQKRASEEAEKTDDVRWLAWFDGSARPNPGRLGIGGVLRNPDGTSFELCRAAGQGDSNQAEYLALIALLEMAVRLQAAPLLIYGDSRVVIDSLASNSHAGNLSGYHAQALALLAQLPEVTLRWIPRRRNAIADALSQRAFGL